MSKKSAGMIVGMLVCALLAGCETTKLTSGETDMDKGEKKNENETKLFIVNYFYFCFS